jgi:hypothetical protein
MDTLSCFPDENLDGNTSLESKGGVTGAFHGENERLLPHVHNHTKKFILHDREEEDWSSASDDYRHGTDK